MKEELININGFREDLYQAMQIGDITLSSKNSQELVDFMNYQDKEIERLNNIIENTIKKCKYLLENNEIEINGKKYYKQKCDDIITTFILEELKGEE